MAVGLGLWVWGVQGYCASSSTYAVRVLSGTRVHPTPNVPKPETLNPKPGTEPQNVTKSEVLPPGTLHLETSPGRRAGLSPHVFLRAQGPNYHIISEIVTKPEYLIVGSFGPIGFGPQESRKPKLSSNADLNRSPKPRAPKPQPQTLNSKP